jgi:adenylate cyclase
MDPTAEEVRAELKRILASEGFANADRMSAFLRYVVDRALAGEGDKVKEYAIGVDVFGRDANYDPRLDSIVRVEARRLRSKLEEYYARAGSVDPVTIVLRRGGYLPVFETKAAQPQAPAPAVAVPRESRGVGWRIGGALAIVALVLVTIAARGGAWWSNGRHTPAVTAAVLPFAVYSTEPSEKLLAARLTDGVTSQLARLGTLGVVSHTTALRFGEPPRRPMSEIARELKANFVVEGSVARSGDRVDVSVRIVNGDTDRKFWVQDFAASGTNLRALERDIATSISSAIVGNRR